MSTGNGHGRAQGAGPKRAANGAANGAPERARLDALWAAYLAGHADVDRNALVEAYQWLVRDVVRRFGRRLPRTVDRGDLQTAANVGLIAAVAAYDPERRVRFESYAEMRIRGALLDELRTEDWLPRPWRQRIERQKRAVESLRSELGREPKDDEVAEALSMGLAEYEALFGTSLPGTPGGSMPSASDGDETSTLEILPDNRGDAPGEKLTRDELLRLVAQRMSELEYRIVYLKYWEELSMREIGELTSLSESRVCKIHSRLIERLKSRLSTTAAEE